MGTLADPALTELLRRTSRSMYLSLAVLPSATRATVALAYLFARAADAVADAPAIPDAARDPLLAAVAPALQDVDRARFLDDLGRALPDPPACDDHRLLARLADAFAIADRLDDDDRARVAGLLETLVAGMRLDLRRPVLASMAELDRYTYQVAGCVGAFWTELHAAHLPRLGHLCVDDAVDFGKGLQLVNILRDVAADAAAGRCYLPADRLGGLTVDDLRQPDRWPALRPPYLAILDLARRRLARGRRYVRAVPRAHLGLHLAARWPLELGLATLDRLARGNPLAARIKLPRRAVYLLLAGSLGRTLVCARR